MRTKISYFRKSQSHSFSKEGSFPQNALHFNTSNHKIYEEELTLYVSVFPEANMIWQLLFFLESGKKRDLMTQIPPI